jgi:hypothetical protein
VLDSVIVVDGVANVNGLLTVALGVVDPPLSACRRVAGDSDGDADEPNANIDVAVVVVADAGDVDALDTGAPNENADIVVVVVVVVVAGTLVPGEANANADEAVVGVVDDACAPAADVPNENADVAVGADAPDAGVPNANVVDVVVDAAGTLDGDATADVTPPLAAVALPNESARVGVLAGELSCDRAPNTNERDGDAGAVVGALTPREVLSAGEGAPNGRATVVGVVCGAPVLLLDADDAPGDADLVVVVVVVEGEFTANENPVPNEKPDDDDGDDDKVVDGLLTCGSGTVPKGDVVTVASGIDIDLNAGTATAAALVAGAAPPRVRPCPARLARKPKPVVGASTLDAVDVDVDDDDVKSLVGITLSATGTAVSRRATVCLTRARASASL